MSKIKKLVFGQKSEKSKKNKANNADAPGYDDTLPEDKPDLEPDDSTMNNISSSESTEPEPPSESPLDGVEKKGHGRFRR